MCLVADTSTRFQAQSSRVPEHGDEQHREDREPGGPREPRKARPDPELHRGTNQRGKPKVQIVSKLFKDHGQSHLKFIAFSVRKSTI